MRRSVSIGRLGVIVCTEDAGIDQNLFAKAALGAQYPSVNTPSVTPFTLPTAAVRDWLHLNLNLRDDSSLLPRRDGRPMTRANVAQRLKLAVDAASVKYPQLRTMSVSPHIVRHSTAMGLLQAGVDPCEIALWLGHESPSTTHMYVEADLAMKARALARIKQPEIKQARYQPPKALPEFLRGL